MASPYLKRPARSLEQAKRDRAERRRQYARPTEEREAPAASRNDEAGEPVSSGQEEGA